MVLAVRLRVSVVRADLHRGSWHGLSVKVTKNCFRLCSFYLLTLYILSFILTCIWVAKVKYIGVKGHFVNNFVHNRLMDFLFGEVCAHGCLFKSHHENNSENSDPQPSNIKLSNFSIFPASCSKLMVHYVGKLQYKKLMVNMMNNGWQVTKFNDFIDLETTVEFVT